MEYVIAKLFDEEGIIYKQEFTFSELRDKGLLRFDFAIFDKNNNLLGLIEYQGRQHFDVNDPYHKESLLKHDNMKVEYCLKHNLPLLVLDKASYSKEFLLEWISTLK